jgi:hypothetical protein
MSDKTHMHGNGESYSGVVPTKQPNKSGQPPAEAVEGRPLTKENMDQPNQHRTRRRASHCIAVTKRRQHPRSSVDLARPFVPTRERWSQNWSRWRNSDMSRLTITRLCTLVWAKKIKPLPG